MSIQDYSRFDMLGQRADLRGPDRKLFCPTIVLLSRDDTLTRAATRIRLLQPLVELWERAKLIALSSIEPGGERLEAHQRAAF